MEEAVAEAEAEAAVEVEVAVEVGPGHRQPSALGQAQLPEPNHRPGLPIRVCDKASVRPTICNPILWNTFPCRSSTELRKKVSENRELEANTSGTYIHT